MLGVLRVERRFLAEIGEVYAEAAEKKRKRARPRTDLPLVARLGHFPSASRSQSETEFGKV